MTNEFKKIKNNSETRYVLETATAGATSAGVIATAPGKKREDSILAQEAGKEKDAPKPRNFVAKNAKMGGAGQHKDKKKAVKQGDVKHKKPLAESYAEDLAKQVFDANPNIKDENAVLDAAWPIAVQDLGKKTAMSMFNYNEDFPSDLVSVYDWLQKGTSEGVSDLSYDAQSLITKLRRDVEEKRLQPTAQAVLAAARELAGDMDFAPQLLVKQVLGQGVAEGFNGEYDDEAGMAHSNLLTTARAVMGLLKTIKDRDNLPEWGQEKIAKAEMMLVSVWDYLQSQKQMGNDPQVEAYGRYDRRDAYQRDYDHSVAGMDRGNNHRDDERHDLDPSDWYIVKDGKMYKTSVYPRQEQEAMSRGYSRTRDEAKAKAEQQGVAEGAEQMTPNWAKYVLDQIYNSNGAVTLTDLFDEGIPGLYDMFMDTAQQHGLDPEEEFQDVQHELTLELEDLIKGGHDLGEGEQRMSRAAKGHEKYGKAGMKALAKAGRDGAGEEKLDKIRNKHDKYDSKVDEVAGAQKCWPGHRKVGTKPGTGKNAGKRVNDCEKIGEQGVAEVAPPGWEKTVKAMKKHDNIDNPFALAWSMKNKGYKSHKKESADPYFESLRTQVDKLAKK